MSATVFEQFLTATNAWAIKTNGMLGCRGSHRGALLPINTEGRHPPAPDEKTLNANGAKGGPNPIRMQSCFCLAADVYL